MDKFYQKCLPHQTSFEPIHTVIEQGTFLSSQQLRIHSSQVQFRREIFASRELFPLQILSACWKQQHHNRSSQDSILSSFWSNTGEGARIILTE